MKNTEDKSYNNLLELQNRLKNAQKDLNKISAKSPANKDLADLDGVISSSTISEKRHARISAKNVIYNIIITICLILIGYSSYNIIIWHKNNVDNNNLIEQVTKDTPISSIKTIAITDDIKIEQKQYDFNNLLSQNPDTIGWISVPNTDIDYPIVKGNDNDFYLNHSFDKAYNAAGWIYADYRNRCDDTDKNLIIYGHNRLNNNMFGTLENTTTQEWLNDKSNYYINYSSLKNTNSFEIFSTILCTAQDSVDYLKTDFSSNEDFLNYISNIQKQSSHQFDVTLTENDNIITLYTCHGLNNERLLVFGKLIKEEK